MDYAQLNDTVKALDSRLTLQTAQLQASLEAEAVDIARWSPYVLKVAGFAGGLLVMRFGPVRLLSMIVAASRFWPRVLAFRYR